MAQETFPILADVDDQNLIRSGATVYADIGSATFSRQSTGVINLTAFRDFNGTTYAVRCILLSFDTSSIPDAATVTGASLRGRFGSQVNTNSLALRAGFYNWDGTSQSDWTNLAENDAITGYAISSIVNSSYNTIPFDAALSAIQAGISKTGLTKLRLGVSQLAADAAPTGNNEIYISSFFETAHDEPRLIVDYTIPFDETLIPDAILEQTNDTKTLTELQRDPDAP